MIQQSRDENIIKKVLGSKIFLFLAVLALIYLVINLGRESYRKHQLTKEVDNLKLEIERLEGSNQQLANLMDYFKEESFIEKEARLKLNLKKPGEKVVILSDYFNTSSNLDALSNGSHNTETTEEESSNYWKWWEYFFQ
ncbi:septum formation initiator family protein [Patescibacteria group bacterium]|nr:septum formation initiator family protein [Patescibacteria group bacterium]